MNILDQISGLVVVCGIVTGVSLFFYTVGYYFNFIHVPNTFTVYETICRKCDKKFSSRNRIITELKYRFHKIYACVRVRNTEGKENGS